MSVSILAQVREAIARVDPNDARQTAERAVTVVTAASGLAGHVAIEKFFVPPLLSARKRREVERWLYREGDADLPETADLVVAEAGIDPPVGAFVFDPARPRDLVGDILARREELGLALARAYPAFRRPVMNKVIQGIARENVAFSLSASLPHLAPSLSLPVGAPDISETAFLTVNQIRMSFLLAAASDRTAGYRQQRNEIAAIIVGAFGWRKLAGWLGGKVPFGRGAIARAAVAYAGTCIVGLSLERLYRSGSGLARGERQAAYGEALARGGEIARAVVSAWREARARPAEKPRLP